MLSSKHKSQTQGQYPWVQSVQLRKVTFQVSLERPRSPLQDRLQPLNMLKSQRAAFSEWLTMFPLNLQGRVQWIPQESKKHQWFQLQVISCSWSVYFILRPQSTTNKHLTLSPCQLPKRLVVTMLNRSSLFLILTRSQQREKATTMTASNHNQIRAKVLDFFIHSPMKCKTVTLKKLKLLRGLKGRGDRLWLSRNRCPESCPILMQVNTSQKKTKLMKFIKPMHRKPEE